MPRPPVKRRKSNSSPQRRAQKVDSTAARQKLERKLSTKPVGDRPVDSDDSDRLVTRTRGANARRSALGKEIYASGGVANGDKVGGYPTRAQRQRSLSAAGDEIIKQNKAKSSSVASKSVSPAKSPLQENKPTGRTGAEPTPKQPTTRKNVVKSPVVDRAPSQQRTPLAELSVLGTLKPRKRQASILYMVDGGNDDSTLNPEDEEQFLPDDESTPANAKKPSATEQSTSTSTSRKRKLDSDASSQHPVDRHASIQTISSREASQPSLTTETESASLPSPTPHRAPLTPHEDDDEDSVMALPQSSSAESTPHKSDSKKAKTSGQQPTRKPLTTQQLQALMPSKRRQGTRTRAPASEFDIPEDSSLSQQDDMNEDEESAFLPRKKQKTRASKKQDHPMSKTTTPRSKKQNGTTRNVATPAKGRQTSAKKSTNTTTKIITPRKPLPLTNKSTNQKANAKSPSVQLSTITKSGKSNQKDPKLVGQRNGTTTAPTTPGKKSYGGHPQRRAGLRSRDGTVGMASAGKENYPTSAVLSHDQLVDSIEGHDSQDDEIEVEVGRGRTVDVDMIDNDGEGTPIVNTGKSRDKWAEIDAWDMDFEEVSVSTGGSSPLRR